jgi:hypothetical protein
MSEVLPVVYVARHGETAWSARALSGKPVVSASADKNTGQMKNVAISNPKSPQDAHFADHCW